MQEYFLKLVNISKKFPGHVALDKITLGFYRGEIHGVLGENGAGKSTLAKVISGHYIPDEGWIELENTPRIFTSPREAMKNGIVMVSQKPQLFDELSIWENVYLYLKHLGIKVTKSDVVKVMEALGISLNINRKVWSLNYTEKQMVELAKIFLTNPKVVIFDEVTTYLPFDVVKKFYSYIHELAKDGKTILFITHKVDEAIKICDRITVLRRGRVVATFDKKNFDAEVIRKAMFGTLPHHDMKVHNVERSHDSTPVLEIHSLKVYGDYGQEALRSITLKVFTHEICCIVGIAGNGQKELIEALLGLRDVAEGKILFNSRDITKLPTWKRIKLGIAYIPEDPFTYGVASDLTIEENLALKLNDGMIIRIDRIMGKVSRYLNIIGIEAPSMKSYAKSLSGGNVQRLAIIKELAYDAKLIIAYNPFRMLDEMTSSKLRMLIKELSALGKVVLLILESVDDAIELCNRIYVMKNGELFEVPRNASRETIGRMMC